MSKAERMQATPTRDEPNRLAVETCRTGLDEAYLSFRTDQAQQEASHHLKCDEHNVCEWIYLLHNHTPQWIELTRAGNIDTAVELSHRTNALPEAAGHVCPQNRLCKGACTIRDEYGAVAIGNIERYISDQALVKGRRPDLGHVIKVNRRMAIIGAGPAGLACADILTCNGIGVAVYDRHPEIGDLLTFGIPSFKLGKPLLTCRREIFSVMGIRFKLSYEVGKDASLNSFLEQYGVVFVGVGAYRSMKAGLPNEDALDIYDVLPPLVTNTRRVMRFEELPEKPFISTAGLNVVIPDGSDTAMDCIHTALRHGTSNVTCVYRCDKASMPGSEKEVKDAREEGASFEFNVQPMVLELSE